jgi:hypothetical protein
MDTNLESRNLEQKLSRTGTRLTLPDYNLGEPIQKCSDRSQERVMYDNILPSNNKTIEERAMRLLERMLRNLLINQPFYSHSLTQSGSDLLQLHTLGI